MSADSILTTGDGVADLGNQVNTDLLNGSAATNDIDALFDTAQAVKITVLTGSGADDITNADSIFNISTGDGNDAVTITNADVYSRLWRRGRYDRGHGHDWYFGRRIYYRCW